MLPLVPRWTPMHLAGLGVCLAALLALSQLDLSGPSPIAERRAAAEILAVETIVMERSRFRNGPFSNQSHFTRARIRLDDGGEAMVLLKGISSPREGARLEVLVTEFDDGSLSVAPLLY